MLAWVALLLIVALATWPLLTGGLVALDTLAGERLFVHLATHEPRRLLESLGADWLTSSPAALITAAGATAAFWLLRHRLPTRLLLALPALAPISALLLLVVTMARGEASATPAPTQVPHRTHVLLVGGGPTPSASEAQIEFNVKWVLASLRSLVPEAHLTVHFADGDAGAPTAVAFATAEDEPHPPLEAVASVYGESDANRLRYRRHTVDGIAGPTHRDTLLPALQRYLEALRPGDQALLVYNGHGSWERDKAANALRLWDESRLSVRDFAALLDRVDSAVPVRFVLTQCYSGAFARAVSPGAELSLELAKGQRCGFMAESEDRQSEGCSASVQLGDYRDYTTYFISALTGTDRLGRSVPRAPDRDGDGVMSPFDAHLHTLVQGYNADLPRSTSEDWLERWEPWESRWNTTGSLPENLYGRMAIEMQSAAGLPEGGTALGGALAARYDSLEAELASIDTRKADLERELAPLRRRMQQRLERRWPQLAHPYTAAYHDLLAQVGATVDAAARALPDWTTLLARQDSLAALEPRLVDLDRRISQLDRLRRTRQLARALDRIERAGSGSDREAYWRLRACEALPLRGR